MDHRKLRGDMARWVSVDFTKAFAPKVQGTVAQGERTKFAPPWVVKR